MNWLYLKESKRYLNTDWIEKVDVIDEGKILVFLRGFQLAFTGKDAAKVIEYLERVAYA